ncbi:MAG TPA: hypothetical protein VKX24_11335 [Acidimicrobiia bacterium]|nr:hypothetical protein [Acidimicrobiia bacterium]
MTSAVGTDPPAVAVPEEAAAKPAGGVRAAVVSHGPAFLGFTVLTAVFFWPVVAHLPTRILSDGADGAAYLWNLWALPHALFSGHNPFATDHLFYPVGALTAFNTNMPLVAVLSWPLQKLFGLGVAANLMQLGAVVLSGFGAYLLADHVTGDRRAAFVAGAAFTFAPYRFAHLSHYDLAHLEFLPFGLLALLRLYERPSRGRALAYGAVVGLTFLTDLYYVVFLLVASAVIAAWHWRTTLTRDMAVRLGQAVATALVVAAPLLAAMLRELLFSHSLDPLTNWANADNYSSDLFSWVTPTVQQRVWATHVGRLAATTGGERLAFPGAVVLLLVAFVLVRRHAGRHRLWLALTGVFVVLSLGPFLHVAGRTGGWFSAYGARFAVPLPYFVLHFVPVVNGVRVPGRFSIMGALALDVLAAVAVARLSVLAGRRNRRWAVAVPIAALAFVLVESYPATIPLQKTAVPRPYAAIAADPGQRAVLEVPLQWRTGFGEFGDTNGDHTIAMYDAVRHGKPLVGGMVARYPERRLRMILTDPLYEEVMDLQAPEDPGYPTTFGVADLAQAGIGYVVYHRDQPRPRAEAYLAGLHLPVLADDGTVIVWKVPSR